MGRSVRQLAPIVLPETSGVLVAHRAGRPELADDPDDVDGHVRTIGPVAEIFGQDLFVPVVVSLSGSDDHLRHCGQPADGSGLTPSLCRKCIDSAETPPATSRRGTLQHLMGECLELGVAFITALVARPLVAVVSILAALASGCSGRAENPSVQRTYDPEGRLEMLALDSNGDGKTDTWSHMDGARIVRIEIDRDEDGTIDRWEYYDAFRNLEKVGTSSARDGRVDTWTYAARDGSVARVEVSAARNGTVSRTEFYERGALVRAEEDTDQNGIVDKWEAYANGVLADVAFDTDGSGRPTRRVSYGSPRAPSEP